MTYKKSPSVTDYQKQVIMGTVLGGSSIIKQKKSKNCYLAMRGKNIKWVEYKSQNLENLVAPNSFHVNKDGFIRWHSASYPIFNNFYDKFYEKGKRKIRMEVLNELRDIAFAIWFLDSGKIAEKKLLISTNCHGMKNSKVINQYFNEIGFTNDIIDVNGRIRIKFDEVSTKKFVELIGIHVPEFMYDSLYGML